jgi:hypothetical protein
MRYYGDHQRLPSPPFDSATVHNLNATDDPRDTGVTMGSGHLATTPHCVPTVPHTITPSRDHAAVPHDHTTVGCPGTTLSVTVDHAGAVP